MTQQINPLAGQPAPAAMLLDVPRLLAAYHEQAPDAAVPAERVAFGTSGHRGSAFKRSFNEAHILAITQAICDYRAAHTISGPLFIGADTHALSAPALDTALQVLAANGVATMVSAAGEFTPTPAVSHAIVSYNRQRQQGFADGIVVTPSHNPPADGGFKYNPPHGGPAGGDVTSWIEQRANELLAAGVQRIKRWPLAQARRAATLHEHDYLQHYVADLGQVIDFDRIRGAGLRIGVHALGGAGVHYWGAIAERYRIDLTPLNPVVDAQFAFMPLDWDGQIRMDPSSPYAMRGVLAHQHEFDLVLACDTDHDRHGIVCPSSGLLPPNHYLSVLAEHVFTQRARWPARAALGKTVVSTALLDRVAQRQRRPLLETPVGFKWFAQGLGDASIGLACEESAGASLLRRDGAVWTTDKDGIAAALMAAEISAHNGRDPGALYGALTQALGEPFADRIEAPASAAQKTRLAGLTPAAIRSTRVAGEVITQVLSHAPGNGAPIGGIKVLTPSGWFAARPSGTEAIYKIYAESFQGPAHLQRLLDEAQAIVDAALA